MCGQHYIIGQGDVYQIESGGPMTKDIKYPDEIKKEHNERLLHQQFCARNRVQNAKLTESCNEWIFPLLKQLNKTN